MNLQYNFATISGKGISTEHYITNLINESYPKLHEILSKIETTFINLQNDLDIQVLNTFISKIINGFEDLVRKEKFVVFPFILKLEHENKLLENCTFTKALKQQFLTIQSSIVEFKKFLMSESPYTFTDNIYKELSYFETSLALIQSNKERYLFGKYKNCIYCKSNS